MLRRKLKEVLQDHFQLLQDTYFESFQIHQVTIKYRFDHRNHDILLIFFISKSLQAPFACA